MVSQDAELRRVIPEHKDRGNAPNEGPCMFETYPVESTAGAPLEGRGQEGYS